MTSLVSVSVNLDPVAWAAVTITAAGAIAAVGYLGRKGREVYRYLHAGVEILHRELQANGGRSIKDDVTGLSVAYGVMARFVDDIDKRLIEHEESGHECQSCSSDE